MTPAEVLLAVVEAAVVLWVEGDRLRFRAPQGALTDELRLAVARCRGALLVLVRAGAVLPADRRAWCPQVQESFEERAGICEFDGDLPRQAAEQEADARTRLDYTRRWLARAALGGSP